MGKRLVIAAVVLVVVAGLTTAAWFLLDWPPPRLLLKYGLPPAGGPTGRTRVIDGMEFVEVAPGCSRAGSNYGSEDGDVLGRLGAALGLSIGKPPTDRRTRPRWAEIAEPIWIARRAVNEWERYEEYRWRPQSIPGFYFTGSDGTSPPTDAPGFISWLSERTGCEFRLPTSVEWEFIARAGHYRDVEPRDIVQSRPGEPKFERIPGAAWILPDRRLPVLVSHRDPWVVVDPDTLERCADYSEEWKGDLPEMVAMLLGVRDMGFRLVWIPPEEE